MIPIDSFLLGAESSVNPLHSTENTPQYSTKFLEENSSAEEKFQV